jgi:hypothetical protein
VEDCLPLGKRLPSDLLIYDHEDLVPSDGRSIGKIRYLRCYIWSIGCLEIPGNDCRSRVRGCGFRSANRQRTVRDGGSTVRLWAVSRQAGGRLDVFSAETSGGRTEVTLVAAGILKDTGGRFGGQGPVEPVVQLGDAGSRGDLGALLLGRPEPAGVHDLEDGLGLGVGGALF